MNCSHAFNQLHYALSGQGEFKAAKTDTCDLVAYYKRIKLGVFVANWQSPSMRARCDHQLNVLLGNHIEDADVHQDSSAQAAVRNAILASRFAGSVPFATPPVPPLSNPAPVQTLPTVSSANDLTYLSVPGERQVAAPVPSLSSRSSASRRAPSPIIAGLPLPNALHPEELPAAVAALALADDAALPAQDEAPPPKPRRAPPKRKAKTAANTTDTADTADTANKPRPTTRKTRGKA